MANLLTRKPLPKLRWWITGVWSAIMILSILVGWFALDKEFEESSVNNQASIVLPIVWTLMSVYSIGRTEIGAVTLWGYPICDVGAGPGILPWGVFQLTRYPATAQQRQFPDDPEKIFKGPDDQPLPDGQVRALRLTTGSPVDRNSKDPLDIQMGLEFMYFMRIQISDPLEFQMKYGTIEEFWRQIRDSGDTLLTLEVSKTSGVAQLIAQLPTLMGSLHDRLKELCATGGVIAIESGVTSPDITHALAAAIRNIGVKRAEATANATMIRETGAANADAEAMLIAALNEKLINANPATVAAYVGERTMGDKTVILGAEGITQLLGLGKMIASGVSAQSDTSKPSDPKRRQS